MEILQFLLAKSLCITMDIQKQMEEVLRKFDPETPFELITVHQNPRTPNEPTSGADEEIEPEDTLWK